MSLSEKTLQGLTSMGFTNPTEVQEKAIPIIMEGKEVVVRSKTGSGKTVAFGIGIYELLAAQKIKKALIIAPVRELALQIMNELRDLGKFYHYRVICVYGGQNIDVQIRLLYKGVDILVATPGRLLDLFERGVIDLNDYDHVVLDEADKMFELGFIEDVDKIISNTSYARKVEMFSATISEDVMRIASKYMKEPTMVEIGEQEKPPQIVEERIEVERPQKFDKLVEIIKKHKELDSKGKILIFVATQRASEYICKRLEEIGITASYIHGDVKQNRRELVIDKFKEGEAAILVATDVAARGLHIDNVSLVINYDEAESSLTHLHRIGRTGRMGAPGKAITFVEKNPFFRPSIRPGFVLKTGPYNPYAGSERRDRYRSKSPRREAKHRGSRYGQSGDVERSSRRLHNSGTRFNHNSHGKYKKMPRFTRR